MTPTGTRATLASTALVTAVSSNLGFTFGVMGPSLRTGLGLSHAALGLLTSVFFACTGVARSPPVTVARSELGGQP